ncbi:MAG TPA: hypothetical protein VLG73_21610, partial [Shinella sp.]|nr:hypothetical protein [Shinella sp.]
LAEGRKGLAGQRFDLDGLHVFPPSGRMAGIRKAAGAARRFHEIAVERRKRSAAGVCPGRISCRNIDAA